MRSWRVVALWNVVWYRTEVKSDRQSADLCRAPPQRWWRCQPDSACGSDLASACSRPAERPRAVAFHVAFTGLAPTWQKDISSHYHRARNLLWSDVCVCWFVFYDQFISPVTVACHFAGSWKVCHLVRFPLSASSLPNQMRQALTHCKHTHAQETSRHECSAKNGILKVNTDISTSVLCCLYIVKNSTHGSSFGNNNFLREWLQTLRFQGYLHYLQSLDEKQRGHLNTPSCCQLVQLTSVKPSC